MKKFVPFIFLSFVVCISFQNCSQVQFSIANDPVQGLSADANSFNNGEGYGGKLDGSYYRFRPNFSCEGREGPVASIQTNGNSVLLIENSEVACAAEQQQLPFDQLEISNFQRDIFGYKEGIFEGFATAPNSIPANLVEVWCRDSKDEKAIETVVHFDRSSSSAVAKIFYPMIEGSLVKVHSIGDFPVSRAISANRVMVQDGNGFELVVYRDQPSAEAGKLKAWVKATVNDHLVVQDTTCRLGGFLDPNLWPAKVIVDSAIDELRISGDKSAMAFSTTVNGLGEVQLYSSSLQGDQKKKLISTMFGSRVDSFDFTPKGNSVVFWADLLTPKVRQLFSVGLSGTGLVQLNSTISHENQATSNRIQFSPDGDKVLFLDGSQEEGGAEKDVEMWLRSAPVLGGKVELLNLNLPTADDEILEFRVKNLGAKLIYSFGFGTDFSLFVANEIGSVPVKVAIPNIPLDWRLDRNIPISVSVNKEYFIVKFSNLRVDESFAYFAIKSRDLPFIRFPTNWQFVDLSRDGKNAILEVPGKESPQLEFHDVMIYNLLTTKKVILPKVLNPTFSQDSKYIFAKRINETGESRSIVYSLEQNVESQICPNALGQVSLLKEDSSDSSVLIAVNSRSNLLEIWKRRFGAECVKLNSLPIAGREIAKIDFAPDQKSVLLKTQRTVENKIHQELFLVPLDGKNSFQIDSATHLNVSIEQAHFTPDSKSILIISNSMRVDRKNAFLWNLPPK